MTNNEELLIRLNSFLEESDTSMVNAGQIERLLDELYPDNEDIQEFVTCLASYRPGGGEFLYDTDQIIRQGRFIQKILADMK